MVRRERLQWIVWVFLAVSVLLPLSVGAEAGEGDGDGAEKTLSPYFLIPGGEGGTEQFPLKKTSADVAIAGVIAGVKVTQVYRNEGDHPIEAMYVFPGSTRAAVHAMRMIVGKRVIEAQIQKKEKAREIYAKAKEEGKRTSLLEQKRPNVFQMNVANIMPGETVQVELEYTETLPPEEGTYEFVYPAVVGPRYSHTPDTPENKEERWVQNPYLTEGSKTPYAFDISVSLSAGMPVSAIFSPSHKVNISYEDKTSAKISLDAGEGAGGNRDFILRYSLEGGRVESGMLLYEGEKEKFFLLTVEPPKRPEPREIPPREYLFVLDVSGSMHGFPIETAKTLIKNLISGLRQSDLFNVLLFAGDSSVLNESSVPASAENVRTSLRFIDGQRGSGGTEILPALRRALSMPKLENYSRSVVVITDGYVDVEKETFDVIRKNLGKANLFAFGIGSSVNRFLIEGMARAGTGEHFVVLEPSDASTMAERFRKYIENPVLTNVKVDFGGFDVYALDPPSVPDLFAQRPITIIGKWRGSAPKGTIKITGTNGSGKYEKRIESDAVRSAKEHAPLMYLWARHRIATLGDYEALGHNDERRDEITNLGLTYHLLTDFTSFVAVDREEAPNPGGNGKTVKQPLPLPQGVSNYAVGGSVPSTPEPETWLMIAVLIGIFTRFFLKDRSVFAGIRR